MALLSHCVGRRGSRWMGRRPAGRDDGTGGASLKNPRQFPVSAGILFGLGLGGFFDGIVLHQVLQWHHMVTSAGYPAGQRREPGDQHLPRRALPCRDLLFVVLGLVLLWRTAHRAHLWWSWKLLAGTMLMGFGTLQRRGGRHRPPSPRAPPRQRDGAARPVDLLGRGVPCVGRSDDRRGTGALSLRPADPPPRVKAPEDDRRSVVAATSVGRASALGFRPSRAPSARGRWWPPSAAGRRAGRPSPPPRGRSRCRPARSRRRPPARRRRSASGRRRSRNARRCSSPSRP